MNRSAAEIIAALGDDCADCNFARGRGHGMVHCPGHEDSKPSLSISETDEAKVLFHCFAGCSQEELLQILRDRGLWRTILRPAEVIVAKYDYVTREDNLLYQVVRYEPKRFLVRRPGANGSWIWDLEDTKRVLYRLPEVVAALSSQKPIFVVEGEKDADALCGLGLAATTCSGGAGKWNETYSDDLAGGDIVIIPDNDEAGRRHARDVAFSCRRTAFQVRVLNLQAKDAAEWISMGGTAEKLFIALGQKRWVPIWLSM